MSLFSKGRRTLTLACFASLVVAALHTVGAMSPPPPDDAAQLAIIAAMEAYKVPMGADMNPSMFAIFQCLALTMTVTLIAQAGLGLWWAADRQAEGRTLSRIALWSALQSGAITALSGWYRIPPPLITMAVVTVLYGLAVWRTRRV